MSFTAFADFRRHLFTGALDEALAHAANAYAAGDVQTVVLVDDETGDRSEIDPRGGPHPWTERESPKQKGPGRPKLGVVSREVSLLPRHWDWLAAQPNGASATLRRLVDEARKKQEPHDRARQAKDAAYKFMSAFGGDLPDFEEAARDLYAGRFAEASARLAAWPDDLRDHARRLIDRAVAEVPPGLDSV